MIGMIGDFRVYFISVYSFTWPLGIWNRFMNGMLLNGGCLSGCSKAQMLISMFSFNNPPLLLIILLLDEKIKRPPAKSLISVYIARMMRWYEKLLTKRLGWQRVITAEHTTIHCVITVLSFWWASNMSSLKCGNDVSPFRETLRRITDPDYKRRWFSKWLSRVISGCS